MSKIILGIDPGPTYSAFALMDGETVINAGKIDNKELIRRLKGVSEYRFPIIDMLTGQRILDVAIESIVSYGAPVGRETFTTCYQIGRIMQVCDDLGVDYFLYPRQEYANAICGCKAKDATVRQALLVRLGGDKKGEPTYLLKGDGSDKRSAAALALYHMDKQKWSAK